MKNTVKQYKVIIFPVLLLLSVFVFLITYRLLTRPAFSAVRDTDCGISEHTHSSECFNTCDTPGRLTLICDPCHDGDNVISHIHDSFCYDQNNELICPVMEYEHCHSAKCYNEDMEIICGVTYHQHSKDCLHIIEEGESFEVLSCGLPSHVHNESCYPAPPVTEEMPDDIEDEIVPYNDADIIAGDDEDYYYDDTPQPFAMFFMEGAEDVDNDNDNSDILTNSVILDQANIDSAVFQYGQKINNKIEWINVENNAEAIPANSPVRLEVHYKDIKKSDIIANGNRLVYQGIPSWIIVDENKTGKILDENAKQVATLKVDGNNAVITFTDEYLNSIVGEASTLSGSFSMEGDLDWRQIDNPNDPEKLPLINLNFTFENDLASRYGDFEVTKTGEKKVTEVKTADGKIHSYLKYELKIKSNETEIAVNNITITDTLSTADNGPDIEKVIVSPGYVGVFSQEKTLGNSASDLNPYETITGAANSPHGKIELENTNLKWTIDKLEPGEERILVYYVELNDAYVGSSSAGALLNAALPEANGFPREKAVAEFNPTANVSVHKSSCGVNLDSVGTGDLSYQIEVKADPDNSYAITNATVKDSFQGTMDQYVPNNSVISVSIKSNKSDTETTKSVTVQNGGFNLPIDRLEPGEMLTITYSVPVTHVYAAGNKDFNFLNHASFVGDSSDNKLAKGHTFGGSDAQTYIYHNSWTRKMNGTTVQTAKTINFGTDKVYNSNATTSNDTSFVVPENAQEYIVIVNEDGTWDMSSATFQDSFDDVRISYTGYLKIEEFDQIYTTGTNTNNISDTKLSSDLNNATGKLKQTIWVDINGQKSFNITPQDFHLDDTNHVYRLTYYASINSESSNIKNIVVSNTFNLTGRIGIGKDWFELKGIGTTVQSTIIGSASYNIEKSGLFYNNGEVYWVIRAEGMLPENMHLQDTALTNNSQPSLAGVYLGDKDAKLSGFATYNDLKNELDENMTAYTIGTRGITYSLVGINSVSELDGKDYALFSRGGNYSGYMIDSHYKGALAAKHIDRISFQNNSVPVNADELPQMWHFQLVENTTDRFYVYYTDSSDNPKFLNIVTGTNPYDPKSTHIAEVSDESNPLTIEVKDNQIRIFANGGALDWFGGNNNVNANGKVYSAWQGGNGANNYHYIAVENTSSSGDFSSDSNGNIYVNRQIDIPKDKAVYMIVRTKSDVTPGEIYSTSYKNEVGVIDNASNIYNKLNEAEFIYKPKKAVYKEPKLAAYYDANAKTWTPYSVTPGANRKTSSDITNYFDTGGQISNNPKNGSGLYMEWLINVNWDGTLEGDYILTDHLDKNKYEPVILKLFWGQHPGYKEIEELKEDSKWEYTYDTDHGDIPYYYNTETGEIKVSVSNLHTGGTNTAVVNMQLICKVIDPDIIFTGQNSTIPNSFSLDKDDGTHINDGIVYHQIRPAYSIDKKADGVGDTTDSNNNNKIQHHTNKLEYVININPNAEDFMVNGERLPDLIDEMSNSMELVDKIKVYEKDGDTKTQLNNISYTTVKGDTTTKITISGLPDSKHLVIEYSTRVNTAPGVTAQIYNSAYWKGYSKPVKPQHTESYSFTLTGDVYAHSNPTIVINKVDKYDSNSFLPYAEFEIRKVDTSGNIINAPSTTVTTDNNGMIAINTLDYNTVYQLKETKAPADYVLDSTPRYFMVINGNHGYTFTPDGKMEIGNKEEQVIVDCAVSSGTDMTLNISNAKGKIKVNKIFQNEDGEVIHPPDNGSFKFGLYEQSSAVPVQILNIVYKNSKPTYLLGGEEVDSPEFTEARAGQTYYVYELDGDNQPVTATNARAYINGRCYDVIYAGNKVIIPTVKTTDDIEVTIKNKEYNIYLPVTGGKGTSWYYKNALRVLMICLTSAIIVIFLKKRHTGHCN